MRGWVDRTNLHKLSAVNAVSEWTIYSRWFIYLGEKVVSEKEYLSAMLEDVTKKWRFRGEMVRGWGDSEEEEELRELFEAL